MVTVTNGSLTAIGQSGRTYHVNFYVSDVLGAPCTFSTTGAAAGANNLPYWICPEQVTVHDVSIKAGPTVTTVLTLTSNGNIIPTTMVAIADNLNTLPYRQVLGVTLGKGNQLSLLQG